MSSEDIKVFHMELGLDEVTRFKKFYLLPINFQGRMLFEDLIRFELFFQIFY